MRWRQSNWEALCCAPVLGLGGEGLDTPTLAVMEPGLSQDLASPCLQVGPGTSPTSTWPRLGRARSLRWRPQTFGVPETATAPGTERLQRA